MDKDSHNMQFPAILQICYLIDCLFNLFTKTESNAQLHFEDTFTFILSSSLIFYFRTKQRNDLLSTIEKFLKEHQ